MGAMTAQTLQRRNRELPARRRTLPRTPISRSARLVPSRPRTTRRTGTRYGLARGLESTVYLAQTLHDRDDEARSHDDEEHAEHRERGEQGGEQSGHGQIDHAVGLAHHAPVLAPAPSGLGGRSQITRQEHEHEYGRPQAAVRSRGH